MCLEAANIYAAEEHLDEGMQVRYGANGYLYNVHYPVNPERFNGKSHDWFAILNKYKDMGEY